MINLNLGALRRATNEKRALRLSAAKDLVQRTLAQHGLAAGPIGLPGGTPQTLTPNALAARFKLPLGKTPAHDLPVPEGAQFRSEHFECTAGNRDYRTYVPSCPKQDVTGVVVMLHGCTQTPEDFAIGTGMNALAETQGFVVIYPHQSRGANAQSCWNWFSRGDQQRDRGEPAILAGLTRKVTAEFGITQDKTFVAGLSAGAAMAVILGETYPDVFAAVGAHSGLPYGAAKDVPSAFAAMAGNVQEPSAPSTSGTAVRTIVFHGASDATVHPSNGDHIARRAIDKGASQTTETQVNGVASGKAFTRTTTLTQKGVAELEQWSIEGLGHAWSGGQPGGSYTDADGPDASAEMIRFFYEGSATEVN